MAKIINTVAKVVAVVAQIGAIIATALGHPEIAAVLQTVAAAAGAVAAVSSFLMKPPDPGGGTSNEWRADPQAPIPYVIGRTAYGGYIVHHSSFGSDNKFIIFATVLSYGPIQEYEAFQADKTTYTFSGGNAVGSYHDHMWLKTQLGATPEAAAMAPSNGTAPGWDSTSKLSGLAADLWELKYDVKGSINFKNGVPKPLRILKGVKVYDPRLDSTFPGGSGACRALNESTYVYSANPWLHAITWALGRWQAGKKVMGVGMPAAALLMASYAEAATIADTNSWTCGGVIFSTDDKWDRLKAMAQAGGGVPIRLGAQLGCLVNTPRVSLATISRGDLAGDPRVVGTTPRRQRMNGIIANYRSEAHDWEVVPASEVRVSAYVTADGGERTRELDLPLVQNVTQAAQLARYEIENNREKGPITLPLKTKWVGYKPGDCLTVDIAEIGLVAQPCIVRNRSFDAATGIVTLDLMTETAAKHTAALGSTGTAPPTTVTTPPDPNLVTAPAGGSWTVTATSVTSGGVTQPALVITGATDNDVADGVVFEYRVNGTTTWIPAGVELPTVTRKEILGVNPTTTYDVAISYTFRTVRSNQLVITSAGTTPAAPYIPTGGLTDPTMAGATLAITYSGTPGSANSARVQTITSGVPTAANHRLGTYEFIGGTPTVGQKIGARIIAKTLGAWSDTSAGTWLEFDLTPTGSITNGIVALLSPTEFGLAAGLVYKINTIQVVGPRMTGWAVDTGTAKRTANATYTAGAGLTFSAAYSQAEHNTLATRIAAIEAALQDETRTMKALKDDLHGTAGHGLIGT